MKSMKSVKAFLFCVAAILTVLFAIAVSKPYKTVSEGTNSVYAVANTVNNAEEVTAPYDSAASTENESSETAESITSSFISESESAVTVLQKDTLSSQTPPSSTKNQEAQTTKALTASSSETTKQNLPQTQKETTTKQVVPTTAQSSSDEPEQMTVYYTKTGKRYHYENPCGKGTYYPTTLADAKSRGLTPCQKCVLH